LGKRATPTHSGLPLRTAVFETLAEALDYAAEGQTGCNFFGRRGELRAVLPYADLREQARALARKLLGLGLRRGARVGLLAETTPDFPRFFFACQYAGLVPVPLPTSIHLGGRSACVEPLRGLLEKCGASAAMAPAGFLPQLEEASAGLGLVLSGGPCTFDALPETDGTLRPLGPGEPAYLQYTSGSTRFPRGVAITQKAVMTNMAVIAKHGLHIGPEDRLMSWLPFYHDMGLVGFVLGPLACQLSVDYLGTRDFAMRPLQWLALMTRSRATISFSPPFGYELCTRRLRAGEAAQFELGAWRSAGVGAETIRPKTLEGFAAAFAPSGFDPRGFVACYGMAECTLGVSFAPLGRGLEVDEVDGDHLSEHGVAIPRTRGNGTGRGGGELHRFVLCGPPLPGLEVEIRDNRGQALPERACGTLHARGPSVMPGYHGDEQATREVLSADGWLNTGDVGYRVGQNLVVTGREKDLIIVNGRNIWPQDLEWLTEQLPGVRTGDAAAFSVPGPGGEDTVVIVLQCRATGAADRAAQVARLRSLVCAAEGVDCFVDLVPPHTLPRTSSGKPSRGSARQEFLQRVGTKELWEPKGDLHTSAACADFW
jgi:fatty-acyl-CoA synthase